MSNKNQIVVDGQGTSESPFKINNLNAKLPEGTIINPVKPTDIYQEVKLPNALPNQPVSAEVKPFPIDTAIIPDTLKVSNDKSKT